MRLTLFTMATNYPSPPASPKALDELLMCPVCLESYKQPKTLTCLHSFCLLCLENCRRPYRRDVTCPVCKKVTLLPPTGVLGLQNDFRIQQIKDIILNITTASTDVSHSESAAPEVAEESASNVTKYCGFCESQQKLIPAFFHCIQCSMCFCEQCNDRHSNNLIFGSHHVIHLAETQAKEVLFCRFHSEHPVKYFCTTCKQMLCTICTMVHDVSHRPEPLEKGLIEKYKTELQDSLKTINSKLYEVKNKTKYLETVKETQQRALYEAQVAIRGRTEALICQIRQKERELLDDVQRKIDERLQGIETLRDMRFYKTSIEQLCSEIQNVIVGSPQNCLLAYEDIKAKVNAIPDPGLRLEISKESQSIIKFVPSQSDLDIIIGTLQECSVSESRHGKDKSHGSSTDRISSPFSVGESHHTCIRHAPYSPKAKKRTASIMHALSPEKKIDVKMGRMKGERNSFTIKGKINADEILQGGTSQNFVVTTSSSLSPRVLGDGAVVQCSSPSLSGALSARRHVNLSVAPEASGAVGGELPSPLLKSQAKVLLVLDQVGGWPGKISQPSSVAFLPNKELVLAEADTRLQVFTKNGKPGRIIAWGKVRPQAVEHWDGRIIVTDAKDRCIKVYSYEGDQQLAWGHNVFEHGLPSGLAASPCGSVIVTDPQRHTVVIFAADGTALKAFGGWGVGDYQFNNPQYVATDAHDNIYVSDHGNHCIKVFDKNGDFMHRFEVKASSDGSEAIKPHGISFLCDHLLIADRENHRVVIFTTRGKYCGVLLSKTDSIRYPCNVKASVDNLVAVVENHNGFPANEPHHAVKVFEIKFS